MIDNPESNLTKNQNEEQQEIESELKEKTKRYFEKRPPLKVTEDQIEKYENLKDQIFKPLEILTGSKSSAEIIIAVIANDDVSIDEIAEITKIYPSTAREYAGKLNENGFLTRHKSEEKRKIGLGKMPYAYSVGDIFSKMENYIKTVHSDFEKVTRCLIENKVAKPKNEEKQE